MGFDPRPQPDEAEAQAIKELKGLIGEVPKPSVGPPLDAPASLLRFVRGYALNASDAAKAFEKMLEYRKERSIDAARAEMMAASKDGEPVWPADLPKFAPLVEISGPGLMRRIGSALGGHPATLVLLHKYEVKKIIRAGLVAMLIEFQQYQDEWWSLHLASRSEAAGKLLARADVIHAGELGIFHFDLGCARVFPQVLASAKHYPESCARITSTGNSGALVAMYNAVIRPFMPAHTREKLHVVGKDLVAAAPKLELEEDTMRALLEQTGLAKPAEPEVVALS